MATRNLPQPFEIDKIRFQDCFTAPSVRHFAVLITGWVLTVGTHTVSQVILTMGLHESEHFTNMYKFLLRGKWDPDMVARQIFLFIVETLLPGETEYETVIDDTLHNHVGSKICYAGIQHDGSAPKTGKPVGYGVCFVTIGLAVRLEGISDRVFCLPYAARVWWPKKSKNKPKWARYKTKTQLAVELIKLTKSWMHTGVTLRVIVDGAYSKNGLIRNRPKGVQVTGRLRTDAALYATVEPQSKRGRGRPRKKGERLATPQDIFNDPRHVWQWIWICLYCPLRGMGEKPSPSGEDFSRPAGPERDRPDLIEAPAAVASNLSGTRGVFRAAAKVEFIRLSEKPPKPPPSGGWSLHS